MGDSKMDTIPDDEFIEIFERVSRTVHFGRSRSPQDVKNRIKRILRLQKKAYQTAKRQSTVKRFRSDYVHLRTLYVHGLHGRIWDEAVKDPGGLIDLTLDYGREKADKIMLERERKRRGKLRRVT